MTLDRKTALGIVKELGPQQAQLRRDLRTATSEPVRQAIKQHMYALRKGESEGTDYNLVNANRILHGIRQREKLEQRVSEADERKWTLM